MLLAYQGWRMSMSLKYRSLVSADTCVLQALARTPYADCRELMALSGRHSRLVEEAVERLHTHRLIRFVWYANAEGWWVRRWFVTSWGAIYLSMLDGADLETVAEDIAMLDELSYQTTMRAKSKRWLKRLLVSLLVAVGLAERPVSPEYEAAMQASKRIRPARPEQYEGGTHDGE